MLNLLFRGSLLALNEVFVGVRTHQSARYLLGFDGRSEHQSSSGLIVATGTGATGWARSIVEQRQSKLALPQAESEELIFFVREPFPSVTTGNRLTEGLIRRSSSLVVVSEAGANGTVFGDGVEDDSLPFDWGTVLNIGAAARKLHLVVD